MTKDNLTERRIAWRKVVGKSVRTHLHGVTLRETLPIADETFDLHPVVAQQQSLLEECAKVLERLRYNQFSMTIEDKQTVDALIPRLRADHG